MMESKSLYSSANSKRDSSVSVTISSSKKDCVSDSEFEMDLGGMESTVLY